MSNQIPKKYYCIYICYNREKYIQKKTMGTLYNNLPKREIKRKRNKLTIKLKILSIYHQRLIPEYKTSKSIACEIKYILKMDIILKFLSLRQILIIYICSTIENI